MGPRSRHFKERVIMRSRRIVVLSVAGLALVSVAGAQGPARSMHFGVLAGAAFAKVGGPDVANEDVKTRVGIAGGGFATLGMSRTFVIEPEVLYAQKGAESTEGGVTSKARLSYVEVPLLLKARFPGAGGGTVVPHVYAGPYFGLRVGCSVSASNGTTTITSGCGDQSADIHIKSSDFGATFGGGVDVGGAIIDVRYDLGLSKLGSETTNNDVKNRVLYLLVGWTFRAAR